MPIAAVVKEECRRNRRPLDGNGDTGEDDATTRNEPTVPEAPRTAIEESGSTRYGIANETEFLKAFFDDSYKAKRPFASTRPIG